MLATGKAVVEFGSGSSAKTPILLRASEPAAYVPIDISGDFLRESAAILQTQFHRFADLSGRGGFHEADRLAEGGGGDAEARLLPRLDDRQSGRADRGRSAPRDEGDARRRLAAADRHGPDQARRGAASRL